MIKESQEQYLATLPDGKVIEVKPFDPRAREAGNTIVAEIHEAFPELRLQFGGAAALGIAGQNDIDILMLSTPPVFERYLQTMEAIEKPHATVASMLESLKKDSRWQEIDAGGIQSGDVIFWEKVKFDDGSENAHVGFALNNHEAVSTDYKQKTVAKHPIMSEQLPRNIEAVYRFQWSE